MTKMAAINDGHQQFHQLYQWFYNFDCARGILVSFGGNYKTVKSGLLQTVVYNTYAC